MVSGSDTGSSVEAAAVSLPGTFSQIPQPKDWSNGDDLKHGTLNKEWRDTFLWLLRKTAPGISVHNADGAALTYTSNAVIPLKVEMMAARGNLTHAVNNSKVYVWEAGWYLGLATLGGNFTSVTASGTSMASVVKVNGAISSTGESSRLLSGPVFFCVGHSFSVYLNPGDYVEIAMGGTWTGTLVSSTQEYTWPRLELFWRTN